MDDFINSLRKSVEVHSSKIATTKSKLLRKSTNKGNIRFLKKTIFNAEVLPELKTALNLISSTEKYTIKNDIVRKMVIELVKSLSSYEEVEYKTDVFKSVFQAFGETCKKEESLNIMQFFAFLCYLLGTDELIISPDSDEVSGFGLCVNNETFKNTFGVVRASWSPVHLGIIKGLFESLMSLPVSLDPLEMQPYHKWLQELIKGLTLLSNGQDVILDIFSIILDIDIKLIEINIQNIFSNMVFDHDLKLGSAFLLSYSNFLVKTIKTFSYYQRLLKFFVRFLPLVKHTPKKLSSRDIFTSEAMEEFNRVLIMMSTQQFLPLIHLLVSHLKEITCDLAQGYSKSSIELTSLLLIMLLREVKLYAPSISNKTLDALMEEMNCLKKVLKPVGNAVLSSPELISKNKSLLKSYMEVSFHCAEIEILASCYKSFGLESLPQILDDEVNLGVEEWNSLVKKYFNESFINCYPTFFETAVQQIRIVRLRGTNRQPFNSTKSVITKLFDSEPVIFDLLQYLDPEHFIFIMENLPVKESRKLTKSLLHHVLQLEDDERVYTWFSEPILLENSSVIQNLLIALLDKTNAIGSEIMSDKNIQIQLISPELFDTSNVVNKEKLKQVPDIVNCLLTRSSDVSEVVNESKKFQEFCKKVARIFGILPLMHMEGGEIKRLAFGFALQLTVLTASTEPTIQILFQNLYNFLSFDFDVTTSFDVGLFFKWLSRLQYKDPVINSLKVKILQKFIETCSKFEPAIKKINSIMESPLLPSEIPVLEIHLSIYEQIARELANNKKRKRKSDTRSLEGCRSKLAKVLADEFTRSQDLSLTEKNYDLFLRLLSIQLATSGKDGIENFNLETHFDFAVNKLKDGYDETCSQLLIQLAKWKPKAREAVASDCLYRIWLALKRYELTDWQVFLVNSTDAEFGRILEDLLEETKRSLKGFSSSIANYVDIWKSFLESDLQKKGNETQIGVQNLFGFVQECQILVRNWTLEQKRRVVELFSYCLSSQKVVLTNRMIDAILDVMVDWPNDGDPAINNQHFHALFVKQIDVANSILLKYLVWNKSKIHITFVLFKRFLQDLTRRSDVALNLSSEDIFYLSACAVSMEKWISQINKMKKDFARITPYFIAIIISSMTTVTILPAVKIHLANCLNTFLGISDSHTVAYLMRAFKPGHQQVFTTAFNNFNKYHKYTGKI